MNKFFTRGFLVFLGACLLYGGAKGLIRGYYDARDPVKVRANARTEGTKTCVKAGMPTAPQKGITVAQLNQYCECMSNRVVDSLSDQELLHGSSSHVKGVVSPAEQEKLAPMVAACHAEVEAGPHLAEPADVPTAPRVDPDGANPAGRSRSASPEVGGPEGVPQPLPAAVPR